MLADFNVAYVDLYRNLTGFDKFGPKFDPATDIHTWHYEKAAGYTSEEVHVVWDYIKNHPTFWLDLPAYPGVAQSLVSLQEASIPMVFITNRMGVRPDRQTRAWLACQGVIDPTVIVTSHKADGCLQAGVTHYIDDKNENIADVLANAPSVVAFMNRRGWNETPEGAVDVFDFEDFANYLLMISEKEAE